MSSAHDAAPHMKHPSPSHVDLVKGDVQIPINDTTLPIPLLQPLISLPEMPALKLCKKTGQQKHSPSPYPTKENQNTGGREELTNPLAALNGLGCTLCSTQCLTLSIFATLFAAGVPHAKNTTPFVRFLATISITFCVNFSQP